MENKYKLKIVMKEKFVIKGNTSKAERKIERKMRIE